MSSRLNQRVRQLESNAPAAAVRHTILRAPHADPGHDARKAFATELEEARRLHDLVIVVDAARSPLDDFGNVKYVPTEFGAQLISAGVTPSKAGRASALDDMLANAQGSTLQPVANDPEHETD